MKEHVEALKQGYFLTILPTCDNAGRPVLYINRSALPKHHAGKDEVSLVPLFFFGVTTLHMLAFSLAKSRK